MCCRPRDWLRAPIRALVERLLLRDMRGPLQQLHWRLLRKLDDSAGTHSRTFMRLHLDIEIGRMTYGAFRIDGSIAPGTRIGAFCSVAPRAVIGGSQHPLGFVTTHPITYLANRGLVGRDDATLVRSLNEPVIVEDDVWLADNCVLLPGVRVGRGAVVGAGAVVTRDVPPYAIALGVPARVARLRVSPDQARRLAAIDWPRWTDERLRAEMGRLRDVEAFLAEHDEGG